MLVDVLTLAEQDTRLHRESRGEYSGPCPNASCRCQTNGFRVKANGDGEWRFMCRGCWQPDKHLPEKGRKRGFGDAIDYLRHFRGMTFQQAKALVYGDESGAPASLVSQAARRAMREATRPGQPPTQEWQDKASDFVKTAAARIWTEDGAPGLEYLHSRGLKDDTIRKARLGFAWRTHPKTGKTVPCIVVPWDELTPDGAILWRVQFRVILPDTPRDERYFAYPGSSNAGLYLADSLKFKRPVVFMVEGEFDALILAQEAGDIVGAVATGSTNGSRTARWLARLARVPHVLLAYDNEKKGSENARYWRERLTNSEWYSPLAHDVNDMLMQGYDVRKWAARAVEWRAGQPVVDGSANEQATPAPAATPAADPADDQGGAATQGDQDAADPASDQDDDDSDGFMLHCATCGASIESPDMDFRYTPDGILYCLPHYPQADEPAQNGQDGSDQAPHDDDDGANLGTSQDTSGIETLRGLLLQTGEALDYPSLEIAHNGRVIPVAGAAHYWRNLAERGERALLVQALALLQDKPAQCCQCDAPVWVFAADGKPYCYQHAPVCAAVAQTRRAESAAPAQGKKRIVEIDGVRMFVGYSDAEYKAAILQEYAGAAQSASEPHRSRPASGVVYCQQHQGRRAVVSDESGAYCHECWQARRFHCSIVESYGHDNGWPRLAVLGIEAGQASYEQFLKAAPEQRLEYASTTLRNPHTRRLFADDAA